MSEQTLKILFLAKEKPFASDAAELLENNFPKSKIIFGRVEDEFPQDIHHEKFDYTISYISPWIIPPKVLQNTKVAAINLHPGPPEYPGIGCTNFALYDGAKEFGITAHHMLEKVDRGNIILVKRFPIFKNDSIWALSQRCYAFIFVAFIELVEYIICSKPLPLSEEKWQRKPYTRAQLNELCRITSDMSKEEVLRRVEATTFPNKPGAFVEVGGKRFEYKDDGN